jgi:hypothetical protein
LGAAWWVALADLPLGFWVVRLWTFLLKTRQQKTEFAKWIAIVLLPVASTESFVVLIEEVMSSVNDLRALGRGKRGSGERLIALYTPPNVRCPYRCPEGQHP